MVINNHNQPIPDYREIIKYERKIQELLNHNVHKYKYVGEEAREYEVIQSVFHEINQLEELCNKQIRWYAIIINLWMSFQQQRFTAENRGGFPGLDLSLLESTGSFKISSQESTAGDGGITTRIEKGKPTEFTASSYIGLLELYVNEVARLGMLVCTREKINTDYLAYKLERIHTLLTELLKDMDPQRTVENREEVLILTIKNASANAIKLGKSLPDNRKESFLGTIDSKPYQKLITGPIQGMDKQRLAGYHNMEAFWNGFIP